MPAFVFDRPIDEFNRIMRLRRSNFTLKDFKLKKEALESGLQIWVDFFKEDRAKGTVDIFYALTPLPDQVPLENIEKIGRNRFIVGKTRSKYIYADFESVPHFLIAGETNAGKSNFLQQSLTTLYLNNPNYKFEMIDLKGGLEFQTFVGFKRIQMKDNAESALKLLEDLANNTLKKRMELFRSNKVNKLSEFQKIKKSDIVYPSGISKSEVIDKIIVVVDEAFDLFMTGVMSAKDVARAKTASIKLAAQGRAVGIHCIFATQRPDRIAIPPLLKANLPGKICFAMPNNASSMTVLDNTRATEIPDVKGRAIYQLHSESTDVQVPLLAQADAIEHLNKKAKKKTDAPIKKTRPQNNTNDLDDINDYKE